MIPVKITGEFGKVPERANPTDAGADLFATEDVIILPMTNYFMDLQIQMAIPANYAGFIYARSGLGSKKGLRPRNCVGVIDSKYRGNLGIMLENHNDEHIIVHKGDRIAQIVIAPVSTVEFVQSEELDMTDDRGGGFGSTGK